MVTGWDTHGYRREKRKQLKKLKKIAKKISPDGMACRAALCCWLDTAAEARKMKRAMKRVMNRALAGAYTTWAADIMGQRGIGAKLLLALTLALDPKPDPDPDPNPNAGPNPDPNPSPQAQSCAAPSTTSRTRAARLCKQPTRTLRCRRCWRG